MINWVSNKPINRDEVFVSDIAYLFDEIREATCIYLDYETTGLDPYVHKPILASILTNAEPEPYPWVIDLTIPENNKKLTEVLKTFKGTIIGHNLKFDLKMAAVHHGLDLMNVKGICTQTVERCLIQGSVEGADLLSTTKRRLKRDLPQPKATRDEFIGWKNQDFEYRHIDYAAADVVVLPEILNVQMKYVESLGMRAKVQQEMELVPYLASIELNGLNIDREKWLDRMEMDEQDLDNFVGKLDDYVRELSNTHESIKGGVYGRKRLVSESAQTNIFGGIDTVKSKNLGNINWNSPKQVYALFDRLGITGPTDKGKRVLNKDAVTAYLEETQEVEGAKIIEMLREYKKKNKAVSSYGLSFIERFTNPVTGKVHTVFRQMDTQTGRLSCGDSKNNFPNFQQMPKDNRYRTCFYADPGRVLITCDLSGAELVILAFLADDQTLRELEKVDKHSYLAQEVWRAVLGDPTYTVTKEINKDKREMQKTINYGLIYGATVFKIQRVMGVSQEEAQVAYDTIWSILHASRDFLEGQASHALRHGWVYTSEKLGSRRWFPEVINQKRKKWKLSKGDISSVERRAKNAPIQGLQSEMLKRAIVELAPLLHEKFGAKIVLQVHDELVIDAPEDQAEVVKDFVQSKMIESANYFLGGDYKMLATAEYDKVWKK